VSLVVPVALPSEYAEAGRVTAEGYHADDLLRPHLGPSACTYSRSPVPKVVTTNMRHAVRARG
jgi:hypothetical protein